MTSRKQTFSGWWASSIECSVVAIAAGDDDGLSACENVGGEFLGSDLDDLSEVFQTFDHVGNEYTGWRPRDRP
ncbi:uncharacterized protein FFB20_12979 [Fusarium fujikuroi]|nr:uncharacterized protein FFB20_12979 [Fusarium fujikuroi]